MLEDIRDIENASGQAASKLRTTQKDQSELGRKIYDAEDFALLIIYTLFNLRFYMLFCVDEENVEKNGLEIPNLRNCFEQRSLGYSFCNL